MDPGAALTDLTGLDLRLLRVSKRLSVQAVAMTAGVSPSRISQIEHARRPGTRATDRYLRGLLAAATR